MRRNNMLWKRFLAMLLIACMTGAMTPALAVTAAAEDVTTDIPAEVVEETIEETTEEKCEEAAEQVDSPEQEDEEISLLAVGDFTIGSTGYETLEEALADASSGVQVVMKATEYTLNQSVSIPSGVTLVLPYSDTVSVNAASHKHPYANSASNGTVNQITWPDSNRTRVLTLADGVKLTVGDGAKLVLGGQYSSNSSGLGGQTYGAHSDIILKDGAEIVVTDGGILSTMGYITGDGKVTVNNGGKVYQPFVITDYHGGTYTAVMFMTKKLSPFNSYSMFNIQTDMAMDSSSYLYGYCDLYASSSHNITTALIVGASNALLNLGSETTVAFIYDPDYSVAGHFGIGKTTVSIDGDAALGSLSLKVSSTTVKTSEVTFPLPYNFTVEQLSGTMTLNNDVKILPGAEVYVAEGATLKVNAILQVFDGFASRAYSGEMYPTGAELNAAGLSERGHLVVDGQLLLEGGMFAGTVESGGMGEVAVGNNVTLGQTVEEGVRNGEKYTYFIVSFTANKTTKTSYNLAARIGDYRNPGQYLTLEKNKTYYAADGELVESAVSYAYKSYNDSDAATSAIGTYATPEEIHGTWATSFNVTFKDGEETVHAVTNLIPGDEITAPEALAKAGYSFKGWNTQADGQGQTLPETCGCGDLTVYAVWQEIPVNYTVTWIVDGEVVKAETYAAGVAVEHPVVEDKEGYSFDGWTTAEAENGDITYTAKWAVNQYTVTWNVDGEESKVEYDYGAPIVKPADPTKEGYTFAGWDGYEDGAVMGAANVTYTAKWTVNQYTVTWIVDDEETKVDYTYGAAIVKPADPTKEGYTFAGWDGYEDGAVMGAQNVTCTAKWTVNQYTVTWIVDGVETEKTYDYGATIVKPVDPTKEGYTFAGWEGYEDGAVMGAENVTFIAKWTVNQYTVTWIVDDEETKVDYTYGAAIVKPADPTKEGYTFASWEGYEDGAVMGAANVTYTAKWTVNKYTVTWIVDGVKTEENCDYGASIVKPVDPTKEGYTFAGWEGYEDGAVMGAENVTFIAKWTVNQYTVTWIVDDEETKVDYTYGAAIVKPADPTKEGYTFAGWDGYEDGAVMGAQNVTCTAKWTVNQYTVTWIVDGVETEKTYDYGATIVKPADPTKEGHTFIGWDGYEDGAVMGAENVTFIAKWTVNQYTITWVVDGEAVKTETYVEGAKPVHPTDPIKEGYIFGGWSEEKVDNGDLIYTAQWIGFLWMESTEDGENYTVTIHNTTGEDVRCMVIAASYNSEGKLLQAIATGWMDIAAASIGTETFIIEQSAEVADSGIFVVDKDYAPLKLQMPALY